MFGLLVRTTRWHRVSAFSTSFPFKALAATYITVVPRLATLNPLPCNCESLLRAFHSTALVEAYYHPDIRPKDIAFKISRCWSLDEIELVLRLHGKWFTTRNTYEATVQLTRCVRVPVTAVDARRLYPLLGQLTQKLARYVDEFEPWEAVRVLGGCASIGFNPTTFMEAVNAYYADDNAGQRVMQCGSEDLARMSQALLALNAGADCPLWPLIARRVEERLEHMVPPDLVAVLQSFSLAGVAPSYQALFIQGAERVRSTTRTFSAHEAAVLAWTFATCGVFPQDMPPGMTLQSVAAAEASGIPRPEVALLVERKRVAFFAISALAIDKKSALSPEDLSLLARAFAHVRVRRRALFLMVAEQLVTKLRAEPPLMPVLVAKTAYVPFKLDPPPSPEVLVEVLEAFIEAGFASPDLFQAAAESAMRQPANEWSTVQLARLVAALETAEQPYAAQVGQVLASRSTLQYAVAVA